MNELAKIDALYGTNDDGVMYRPYLDYTTKKGGVHIHFNLLPDDWKYDPTTAEYSYQEFLQLTAEEHERVLKVSGVTFISVRVDRGALACQLRFTDNDTVVWCTQRRLWMTYREWEVSTIQNQFME